MTWNWRISNDDGFGDDGESEDEGLTVKVDGSVGGDAGARPSELAVAGGAVDARCDLGELDEVLIRAWTMWQECQRRQKHITQRAQTDQC